MTRILVVEDESIVVEDLVRKLKRIGYEVAGTAVEGAAAVSMARDLRPDLVLMDILLETGDLDGIEAADAIRQEVDIPVIYLTAHSDPQTLERAKVTGPFGYILKPFEERELTTQIELGLYKHKLDSELRRQRELLSRVFDNIPVLLVMWDPRLQTFTLNRRAEEVLGWSTEEANERDLMALAYPDPDYRAQVTAYMQSLEPGWREWSVATGRGERVPVEWANIRLTDDTMIGIGIDLRERKAAEEALRRSEERLRQAMEAGRVFSFEWEPASDAVHRSDSCGPILGVRKRDCAAWNGRRHFERIPEQDAGAFADLVHGLTPEDPEYETEYRYVREDGKVIWLEESGRAEFDENGTMLRLRGVAADVTERIEAQAREREAAAAIAAAQSATDTVNAMGEGVMLLRLDGTVITANPAAEALTGLENRELIGRNLRALLPELLDPRDQPPMLKALDEVAQGRIPLIGGLMLRSAGPARASVIPSVTFIMSPGGKPLTAVLTLKDVTELHQTAELLSEVFNNTHIQIAYLDRDFRFVRVNQAYAGANMREPEDFEGRNHFELFPDRENEAIFKTVRETGEPFFVYEKPFEFPEHPQRGVTYWDWSLRPVKSDAGETQGFILCLLDVSERVRTRHQLVASEQKYRELVEQANSIIMRITRDHKILFFNEYAQRFFGYEPQEILGKSVIGTIVPETDSEGRDLRKMTEEITAHPELHGTNENENMCKDGSRVWVHWANRAIRNERGDVQEILCVGTDHTARKRLEREAELYRVRLRDLADRLAVSEEQERRRVSTQIHDTVIQTLSLATIRLAGLRGAMQDTGVPEGPAKVEQVRGLVETGIAECRSLMADLTPPLLYEIGLGAALHEFAEKQRNLHGVTIEIEQDEDPMPLSVARRGFVFQATRELIVNAMKHSGVAEIRVRLTREQGQMCIEVCDHGKGFDISAAKITPDEKGGFGLFNIQERLRGMGGRVALESAPGKGTTAKIVLPLEE